MAARPIFYDENAADEDALFDISNRKRLGISENEIISSLMQCVKELVEVDKDDEDDDSLYQNQ